MNPSEIGQLLGFSTLSLLCLAGGVLLMRLGWAWARRIERKHVAGAQAAAADERLAVMEEECGVLRQEVQSLAERLDFAERMLASRPVVEPRRIRPPDQPDLLITPH